MVKNTFTSTSHDSNDCRLKIENHIEKHLGTIDYVFHEVKSDLVHIDVYLIGPTEDYPFTTLVTSGMSDLPMAVPNRTCAASFAELMISLPADWKFDKESLKSEEWDWPRRLLTDLARYPHRHNTWIGPMHTIENGKPFAANTELCGVLITPAASMPDGFDHLRISSEKEIRFLSVIPIFGEEMEFKIRNGSDELIELLIEKMVGELVNPTRENVAKSIKKN